jgi:hypothetical protein
VVAVRHSSVVECGLIGGVLGEGDGQHVEVLPGRPPAILLGQQGAVKHLLLLLAPRRRRCHDRLLLEGRAGSWINECTKEWMRVLKELVVLERTVNFYSRRRHLHLLLHSPTPPSSSTSSLTDYSIFLHLLLHSQLLLPGLDTKDCPFAQPNLAVGQADILAN